MLPNNETVDITADLAPQTLPKLKDLRINDAGHQTLAKSIVEDSKQTKEEFEKHMNSQLGPEEEAKRVQSEGRLSISSLQKSVIAGKF